MRSIEQRDEYLLRFAAIAPELSVDRLLSYAEQAKRGVSITKLLAGLLMERAHERSRMQREALAPLGERSARG